MAGLLDFDPENPADLSLLAMDSSQVAPGLAAQPDAAPAAAPPATMADQGPGFWQRLGQGFVDVGSGLGEALGGGLDESITGKDRERAGIRALMSASLNMLANSGPSYTPRNFGQIAAASLAAAGETNQLTELNQFRRDQAKATLALRADQAQWQNLVRGLALKKFVDAQKGDKGLNDLIDKLGGGAAPAPAGGPAAPGLGSVSTTTGPVTPQVQSDFVTKGAPLWDDVAQKTGFSPEFVAGLSAHETGWGTSPAAQRGNLFGLTGPDRKPLSYPDPMSGVNAFVTLVNSDRFKGVDRTGSPAEVAGRLAGAGYNTEDKGYAGKVGAVVGQVARLRGAAPSVQTAGPAAPTPPPAAATPPTEAPGGTMAAPAAPPQATAPTPQAEPTVPATTTPGGLRPPTALEVPPPDRSATKAALDDAARTRQIDLAAARSIQDDPKAKAAAITAAQEKYSAAQRQAAKDDDAADQDYQKRLGAYWTTERHRQEDAAKEQAKLDAQQKQAMDLENLKARNVAAQSWQTAANKMDADRLQKLSDSAQQATRMIRDTRALQQIATGMGPANAAMDTELGRHIRDWRVTLNLGSESDLSELKNQQAWDRLIGGLFGDTHVTGLGNQTDREGQWLMNAWGGVSQTPLDRLTQLAIVRKLAEERVRDHQDAQDLFRDPANQSLKGLDQRIAARTSLFDRPPPNPQDTAAQGAYNARHPVGEPFYSWAEVGKGSGNWRQYWTRRTGDKNKPLDYITQDVSQ